MAKNYWMVVQTTEDFEISREMGFTLHGLRFSQRRRAQRMEPKDSLLYYVSGTRRWSAIATVTSRYFEDRTPIWNKNGGGEEYPYRVKLEPALVLDEKDYIDALQLAPRLEYLKRWAPERWPEAFVDTLHLLPQRDFRLIESEMKRVHPKWKNRRRSRRQPHSGNRGRRRDFHVDGDGPTLMYEPPRPVVGTTAPADEQAPDSIEGDGHPPEDREERLDVATDAQVADNEPRIDADGDAPTSELAARPEADGGGPAAEVDAPADMTADDGPSIEQEPGPDADANGTAAEVDAPADMTADDGPSIEQEPGPDADADGTVGEQGSHPEPTAEDRPSPEQEPASADDGDAPTPGYKPRDNANGDASE